MPVITHYKAPPQDDSSSEETQGSSSNTKPIVPPRPRNLAFDRSNEYILVLIPYKLSSCSVNKRLGQR